MSDENSSTTPADVIRLTASEKAYLSLSQAFNYTHRAMASALRFRRLADYMSKPICLDEPVYLLSLRYPPRDEGQDDEVDSHADVQARLVSDISSKLWFTYRTGFARLGLDSLTSDVGWGCTLRSCQMMLAQALVMHFLGRLTSLPDKWRPTLDFVTSLLYDAPGAAHPFSIHSICAAGAQYGLVPGKWMGPYGLCRALQDLADAHLAGDVLQIRTLDSGGGVPCLDFEQLSQCFAPRVTTRAKLYMWPDRLSDVTGLLILLPVVLGLNFLNEVYAEQLQAVLRMPQSVGIVGGRPGHSLYFVGYQDQKLLYLDPHDVQPTEAPQSLASHSSDAVLTVSMTAVDSTMALGFYCHSVDELRDLCSQVGNLQEKYRRAPLLCVGANPQPSAHMLSTVCSEAEDDAMGVLDDSPGALKRLSAEDSAVHVGADRLGSEDWELVQ